MLRHHKIAKIKASYPNISNLSSRFYSAFSFFKNRRIVEASTHPFFDGEIINAVTKKIVRKENVVNFLESGHILIAKNLLKETNLEEPLNELLTEAFGVEYSNLENIHELLDIEQILSGIESLKNNKKILSSVVNISRSIFSSSKDLYVELMPNLRPHVPHEVISLMEKDVEKRVGKGKLNAHGPHKDSWRFHPKNTINIWVALSPVEPLNGMFILPHSTDYSPKFSDNEIVPGCGIYPEMHWVTEMEAGDAVIFRSELLHGSILNQTSRTRFALSMRCTIEFPKFHKNFMYNYVQTNPYFSNLTWCKLFSKSKFSPPSLDSLYQPFEPSKRTNFIHDKDSDSLSVKTSMDEVRTFCAKCPHQGIPLEYGWLEGEVLVCSQHQLRVHPTEQDA
jgi:hypothetical protein